MNDAKKGGVALDAFGIGRAHSSAATALHGRRHVKNGRESCFENAVLGHAKN